MTESDDGREPDLREDPRKAETGQGLPEENPGGGAPGGPEGEEARESDGASSGAAKDSPPSKATGNPNAAGG